MKIKTQISKWDLIKLKSLCTAKETINKMKRQPSEWENIFENDMTDKGLLSNIQTFHAVHFLYTYMCVYIYIQRADPLEKTLMLGKIEGRRRTE